MNVAIIDLLTQVPYYDRYLSESVAARVDEFCLYAARFQREPAYFDDVPFERSPELTDQLSRAPIRARRVRQVLRAAEYSLNWLALLERFRRHRPDVVHIQWLPMLTTSPQVETRAVDRLRRMGIPIVYTVHNYLPHDTGTRFLELYQRLYATVDHLVVHTTSDYRRLIEDFAIPEAKVSLIPQGPAFAEQNNIGPEAARRTLGLAPADVVLLMLGVIRPYKGLEPVLEALGQIARERPDLPLKLIVAGSANDQRYLRDLQALAHKLGLEEMIRWQPAYLPSNQMGLYHAAADVVLFPYHDISQSAAFLTAGGLGKCTLTTAVGGLAELIQDGHNGVQIASSESERVAEGLRRCLDLSPAQRAAMGQALQEQLQAECSWDAIGQQTVDLYQRIARQRPSPAARQ